MCRGRQSGMDGMGVGRLDRLESVWSAGWSGPLRHSIHKQESGIEQRDSTPMPAARGRQALRPFSFLALTGNGKCRSPLQRISILSDFPVRHSSPNEKRNGSWREKMRGRRLSRNTKFCPHAPSHGIDLDGLPSRSWDAGGRAEGGTGGRTAAEASRRSLHSFLG